MKKRLLSLLLIAVVACTCLLPAAVFAAGIGTGARFAPLLTSTIYSVSFEMNGHGKPVDSQWVQAGTSASMPAKPSESGWRFDGWYSNPACTDEWDFATPVVDNITLYALWTEVEPEPAIPQTGDSNELWATAALAVMALGACVALNVYRRKSRA